MKILLVYTGSEQGSWGSIAFSRPQHYYIMPGILYCAAALRKSGLIDETTEIVCKFFNTTVETEEQILGRILAEQPDIVGFSCYCWNIDIHKRLMKEVRNRVPGCALLCGGPEVKFSGETEVQKFFNENPACDAVLFGEAELRIAMIVKLLIDKNNDHPDGIGGFAFNPSRYRIGCDFSVPSPVPPEKIPSPYPFDSTVALSQNSGKAMVFETMRGCPQKCVYCQFSRRDHTVRKFPLERVYRELEWLLDSGIECLHVADSVFDIDVKRACSLLDFFCEHNRTTSLFCYGAFVTIDESLADRFEAARAQIGVGVQSTNPETLKIIERTILPARLLEKGRMLRQSRLNFYVDLMFGLPGDTPALFDKSFNDTVALNPSFMMLFPLSLIKGTPLGDAPKNYGVGPVSIEGLNLLCDIRYDNNALAEGFAAGDLERFDDMALACFYFYNRFTLCIMYLLRRAPDAAVMMASIGHETKKYLRKIGRKATNTDWLEGFQETIKAIFMDEALRLGAGKNECDALDNLFKLDIYRILAVNAPQREKIFRKLEPMRKYPLAKRVVTIETINSVAMATSGKMIRIGYAWSDLCNLAELRDAIVPAADAVFLHAPFEDWDARIVPLSPLEQSMVETLPADRPLRMNQFMGQALRTARKTGAAGEEEKAVHAAIVRLTEEGIIYSWE